MKSEAWRGRLRYGTVIVLGFGLDFGLTLALNQALGLPIALATTIGFCIVLGLNYLLFEFWVFAGGRSGVSPIRMAITAASAGLALGVRIAVIWTVQRIIGDESLVRTGAAVLTGALASMVVNYLVVSAAFAWSRRRDQA